MAFVPVPDTVQVNIVYSVGGQEVENVLYFTKSTTPILEDIQLLVDEVNAFIRGSLLPALSSAISLVRVVGVLLDVVDGLQAISTTSLPAAGGDTSDVVPNNVALCISARTGVRGRSFRGRNYIPGISRSHITGSVWASGSVSGLVTIWTNLGLVGVDDGWVRTIVSRVSGGAPRTTGVATPVTSVLALDNVADSQRRRLPGRGS